MSKPRTAGFRFFWSDGVFIAALCALAWFARDAFGPLLWIIPFAAGHFFLFCNVFRVRRSYELVWTGCCLANFGIGARRINPCLGEYLAGAKL